MKDAGPADTGPRRKYGGGCSDCTVHSWRLESVRQAFQRDPGAIGHGGATSFFLRYAEAKRIVLRLSRV